MGFEAILAYEQWNALVAQTKAAGIQNCIAVCDVSGSMGCEAAPGVPENRFQTPLGSTRVWSKADIDVRGVGDICTRSSKSLEAPSKVWKRLESAWGASVLPSWGNAQLSLQKRFHLFFIDAMASGLRRSARCAAWTWPWR